MSNLPQSDLILAGRFVDGDLPAHEATQAEARIVKDATFAAAVEQIRNQSFLLGKLPKFKPSDDLADRTLQASLDQVKAIMGAWPIERCIACWHIHGRRDTVAGQSIFRLQHGDERSSLEWRRKSRQ